MQERRNFIGNTLEWRLSCTNLSILNQGLMLRPEYSRLTHWGRVTHICVGNLTITGSDNGLSPGRRQAIIWTNAGILLIGTLGTNFSEILIEILTFSFKNMRLKVSSGKWQAFCLGPNVLTRSMPWPLMPWLLVSPGHQQPWQWHVQLGYSCLPLNSISQTSSAQGMNLFWSFPEKC